MDERIKFKYGHLLIICLLNYIKGYRNLANAWGIPKDIENLVLERDQSCVYCGCAFGAERSRKRSWEHIINDINITTVDNIALCCVGCNASKGNKSLKVWFYSENAQKRGINVDSIAEVVKKALDIYESSDF